MFKEYEEVNILSEEDIERRDALLHISLGIARAKTKIEELGKELVDLEEALDILDKEHKRAHNPEKKDGKEKTESETMQELYFYVIKNVVGRNESVVFLDEPANYIFVLTDRHDKVFRYLIPKGTKIDVKKEANKIFEAWRFGKMSVDF